MEQPITAVLHHCFPCRNLTLELRCRAVREYRASQQNILCAGNVSWANFAACRRLADNCPINIRKNFVSPFPDKLCVLIFPKLASQLLQKHLRRPVSAKNLSRMICGSHFALEPLRTRDDLRAAWIERICPPERKIQEITQGIPACATQRCRRSRIVVARLTSGIHCSARQDEIQFKPPKVAVGAENTWKAMRFRDPCSRECQHKFNYRCDSSAQFRITTIECGNVDVALMEAERQAENTRLRFQQIEGREKTTWIAVQQFRRGSAQHEILLATFMNCGRQAIVDRSSRFGQMLM